MLLRGKGVGLLFLGTTWWGRTPHQPPAETTRSRSLGSSYALGTAQTSEKPLNHVLLRGGWRGWRRRLLRA